jgi:hypothetical protein
MLTIYLAQHLPFHSVNWLAVIVSALLAFMLGGLWYGPLFSKPWIKAQGWSEQRIEELKSQMNPAKFFGGMIVSYLVLATVMALMLARSEQVSLMTGIHTALLIWVAVACITMTHQLASGRTFIAYVIDAGCQLIYLLAMGAILALWR